MSAHPGSVTAASPVASPVAQTKLSLVIPFYDQAERLALTLASLRFQRPGAYSAEVILVDDGSTDSSPRVAERADLPFPRSIVRTKRNVGRAAARNRGVAAASGDVVLFLDGDMIAAPDLLAKHAHYHQLGRVWSVTGATRLLRAYSHLYPDDRDLRQRIIQHAGQRPSLSGQLNALLAATGSEPVPLFGAEQLANGEFAQWTFQMTYAAHYTALIYEHGPELEGFPMGWVTVFTGNLSVPMMVLKDVGPMDEDFRGWGFEDHDLGFRLHLAGYGHYCALDVDSYHQEHPIPVEERKASGRENLTRLCRKHRDLRMWVLGFGIGDTQWDLRTLGRMLLDYQHLRRCGAFTGAQAVFRSVVANQAARACGYSSLGRESPAQSSWNLHPSAILTTELKGRAPWLYRALDHAASNGLWPDGGATQAGFPDWALFPGDRKEGMEESGKI